jgi:hypothetical protein
MAMAFLSGRHRRPREGQRSRIYPERIFLIPWRPNLVEGEKGSRKSFLEPEDDFFPRASAMLGAPPPKVLDGYSERRRETSSLVSAILADPGGLEFFRSSAVAETNGLHKPFVITIRVPSPLHMPGGDSFRFFLADIYQVITSVVPPGSCALRVVNNDASPRRKKLSTGHLEPGRPGTEYGLKRT